MVELATIERIQSPEGNMTYSPETEAQLRKVFKGFNHFMLLVWRLGLARYGNPTKLGGAVMVIKHRGRKSGLIRYAPVNFAEVDGDIYCTAGFGTKSHWYQNLRADPNVELWLPDSRWAGVAEEASDDENRVEILRAVLVASGFAGPLFGANPRRMSDDQIQALIGPYRLMRIRRVEPVTGPGGPGDLAWVWPLATLILMLLLLRRDRRRT
jgi:deazaflavin-dependent oxidoreductase (nitroreductase family)